jgi:hypothetical protein
MDQKPSLISLYERERYLPLTLVLSLKGRGDGGKRWIPACAGMTGEQYKIPFVFPPSASLRTGSFAKGEGKSGETRRYGLTRVLLSHR